MVCNIHLAGSHLPRGGLLVLFSLSCMLFSSLAESPPRFITFPVNQTGISGGVASFVCQARGEPKPTITWFKIGKKISSQRFEVIEFDGGSGLVLRIQPLRVYRDAAIYKCSANNSAGEVSVSARLEVLEGSLQIKNSEESDQGKYECVATNSLGVRYSGPANLYVRVRNISPRFSILPYNQEVMAGDSVSLTCVAVGSPMPFIKWTMGPVDLTEEDEMPLGRSVLELTNIQESANYTCVAMSSLGITEATAQVTVKDQPKHVERRGAERS